MVDKKILEEFEEAEDVYVIVGSTGKGPHQGLWAVAAFFHVDIALGYCEAMQAQADEVKKVGGIERWERLNPKTKLQPNHLDPHMKMHRATGTTYKVVEIPIMEPQYTLKVWVDNTRKDIKPRKAKKVV